MRRRSDAIPELGTGDTLRLLGRALRYVAPFRGRFAVKLGLLLASLLPLLFLPWPIKIIVDHVILQVPVGAQETPYPALLAPLAGWLEGRPSAQILLAMLAIQALGVLLFGAVGGGGGERDQADAWLANGHDQATRTENEANAGFSLSSGVLGMLDFQWTLRLTQALNHHYRSRLFDRIQALPMPAFEDAKIGDAVFRVMYDTPAITNAVYRIVLTPIGALVFSVLVLTVMQQVFGDHPPLVWAGGGLLAVSLVATWPFAARLRRRSAEARRAGSTTTSTLEEGLGNILAVQSLGGEERERRRFAQDSWASFGTHRSLVVTGMLAFCAALVPGLLLAAWVFHYAADLVIRDRISVGDLGLLLSYFGLLAFACIEVGALWVRVQASAAGLERVFFLMDLPAETDPPDAICLPSLREAIRIEDAGFVYPDGTRALEDVSLELRRGSVTALVGPAGAGKTTLAYLIPRFAAPSRGRVLFDGVDVAQARLDSLRRQVAFVFQETLLFDATVAENLRIGRPDASDTELARALRQAGAEDFVRRLPQGLATPLGRAGGQLSVGQKQRLSIARALVRDAPVLILDEPTSALDPTTERQLVASLREASRDRVVVVIAHRLSTIRAADQILFLDGGRVVERGSHEELMQRDGAYRRFVEMQAGAAA